MSLTGGLHFDSPTWTGRFSVRGVTEQDRVFEFEDSTPGYTMLDAQIGYRFFLTGSTHEIVFKARNLTDEEARSHVSFLKEVAPLPGRDFRIMYRLTF